MSRNKEILNLTVKVFKPDERIKNQHRHFLKLEHDFVLSSLFNSQTLSTRQVLVVLMIHCSKANSQDIELELGLTAASSGIKPGVFRESLRTLQGLDWVSPRPLQGHNSYPNSPESLNTGDRIPGDIELDKSKNLELEEVPAEVPSKPKSDPPINRPHSFANSTSSFQARFNRHPDSDKFEVWVEERKIPSPKLLRDSSTIMFAFGGFDRFSAWRESNLPDAKLKTMYVDKGKTQSEISNYLTVAILKEAGLYK